MSEPKPAFKPFVSADENPPELTVTSIVIGILMAILFGAANAYLGLRVGMTVSASIPAAVISMGVIRFILRKDSILENNMVQTIGSAGESVAAGAIFTLPAIFLWAKEGVTTAPSLLTIAVIAAELLPSTSSLPTALCSSPVKCPGRSKAIRERVSAQMFFRLFWVSAISADPRSPLISQLAVCWPGS